MSSLEGKTFGLDVMVQLQTLTLKRLQLSPRKHVSTVQHNVTASNVTTRPRAEVHNRCRNVLWGSQPLVGRCVRKLLCST
jgi:hypothetical protein